jgi:ubiquinone/menaquinone biosynthesis C-methylase UbiE
MDYIVKNKLAWEEAFERRRPGWGDNHWEMLVKQALPFFNRDMAAQLKEIGLQGKTIAQFCCNNGRELLSAMQLEPVLGVGFDIAENFIVQAKQMAAKVGQTNCEFVAGNILEIDPKYDSIFDLVFFTVGAITWFEDLGTVFAKVEKCLKPNGKLLINDYHPFMNMLPVSGEEAFDSDHLNRVTYPYFKNEPWVENSGMSYITPEYRSKPFTCFSHTISDIVNGVIGAGITLNKLMEFDYDVGLADEYEGKEFPLSFILVGEKK